MDGIFIKSGDITHLATVIMEIQNYEVQRFMFIVRLGHYPIILGIPQLQFNDVAVRFVSNTSTFGSQYCITHGHNASGTLPGEPEVLPEPVHSLEVNIFQSKI